MEQIFEKSKIKELLQQKVLFVKFKKVSGQERIMKCSLLSKYLPIKESIGNKSKETLNNISVWDLDKNNWRSFRVDSIEEITECIEK